jgi:hypothetical protein
VSAIGFDPSALLFDIVILRGRETRAAFLFVLAGLALAGPYRDETLICGSLF